MSPEMARGTSLVGELRQVVALILNLSLRSDEADEVLSLAEDIADGVIDEEETQEFIATLSMFVEVAVNFLEIIRARSRKGEGL